MHVIIFSGDINGEIIVSIPCSMNTKEFFFRYIDFIVDLLGLEDLITILCLDREINLLSEKKATRSIGCL